MPGFTDGDVIVLVDDIPEEGLKKGQIGTIVMVFTDPTIAYETEFTDHDGRTTAQLALLPHQVERWVNNP